MSRDEPGSKSTLKIVLIILGGGGLLLLLCCGGLAWWGKNMVQKVMITDPDGVRARAAAISDIAIPEKYPPLMAMDMSAVGVPMTMCMFMPAGSQSGVILMQMSGPMAGNKEQMKQQFQRGMQQQGQNQQINVSETETRTYRINGEDYEFEFLKGTRPQDNAAVRQVMGVIPGKSGTAFLMVMETEENWDEAAITGMIESLGATLVETSDETPAEETATETESAPEGSDEPATPVGAEAGDSPAESPAGANP